jgi:NAD(P)-dependent dehydrogenase (short-subunit alcohol dehydrogenase family)
MKVNNKVIVVTGGGSGIGRELVLQLVQKGATVAAGDINPDSLEQTKTLAGENQGRISLHKLDVSNKDSVNRFLEEVLASHGAVDGLINNAGVIQPFMTVNDLDDNAIERVLHVNLYGQIYTTKAFLPHLLTRDVAHIVNISSMGGFFPFRGQTLYGASKAAIKLFTEGLYTELIDSNVKVTVVFPGSIDTNITRNSNVALDIMEAKNKLPFSPLPPQKAAQKIISGMEHDKFQVYVGTDSKVMNLLYKLNPRWSAKLVDRVMKAVLPF